MSQPSSCVVAPYTKRNNATLHEENTTTNATVMQPDDLVTLSLRVLKRNQCNHPCNSAATSQLQFDHSNATYTTFASTGLETKSCGVAFYKGSNSATQELRNLIEQISRNHGSDDTDSLNEYINDVIHDWSHDLQKVLTCFRNLATQSPINKWK